MNALLLPNQSSAAATLDDFLNFRAFVMGGQDSRRGANARADADAQDALLATVDGVELSAMWTEFNRTIAMWNQQRDALVNLLTFDLTKESETVRVPVEQDFEEASEFGVPKGITQGSPYRFGFTFKWWDLAIRYTWRFLLDATADELRALNNQAMEADNRLMFTRVMRQVFNNAGGTAVINTETLNVYPFYNGDSMVPPKWKNTTHTTGHDHYLVSGASTVDSGDLDDMVAHMTHHGYSPTKGHRMVLLVNEQEGADIRTFSVGGGDKYDFIPGPAYGGGVFRTVGDLVAAPSMDQFAGLNTIGTYGPLVIVEENYIPAGYMFSFVTGGEGSISNPVGLRNHQRAEMKGLRLVQGPVAKYPLQESYYLHGFGTGVRHRGAGVVMQVKASGSYDIPSAYA